MATFTSLGIGSNLNLNDMVTQLVALERAPLTQMQKQATSLQTQVSAFGKIQSLFSDLQSASNKLTDASQWNRTVASSSDSSAVTTSGGAGAAAGNYSISVQRLAANQTVASGTALSAATDLVGAGTLTLRTGSWSDDRSTFTPGSAALIDIDVTATDTLQSLRDKINASGGGVTATLVTDASGVRLSLRSSASGQDNGFQLTATDSDGNHTDNSGLSRFAYDPEGGTNGLQFKQAGSNALAVVNGVDIESATNDLSGAIDGLTLKLSKVTTSPITLTVTRDSDSVTTAIKSFADAYNALATYISQQTKYDAGSKTGGPLQGDSAATSLQTQMRAILASASGASAAFPRLSDIGLQVTRDGTLSVDSSKLSSAVGKLDELKKAFANNDATTSANNGFARRYADLATRVLGVDGTLTTRTDGLRKLISKNSDDQDKLNDRVDRFQTRLVAQYTAMDANLAKLNALSSYVTQQLNALSASSSSSNK
jgi:flagellar hook-associated protein 2